MALFDFFKRETPKETIDLDKEATRIAAIYETYPEFPVMSADRDVDIWLQAIANGSVTIVPKEHMTRNEDGLLPGEVLLLDWVNEKDSTFTDFPDFFEMEFGIDPVEATNQLLFSDYLDILNEPSVLEFWSLTQLNDVLEENSLTSCSDKKQAIIKIKKEFSKDYITNMIDPGIYVLMEKGQKIVEKYADFIHEYLDTPPK
ncbi:hypothetical protein JZO66_15865 [Enterococcus sp. DIV0242_7C1]|uniref:Uncharacterized protein n=1 Tax=Candidatus Enterococcus dunnyi TaxID=1834192 RepID=A0A200J733_9ENTE|nr:MULTISPECIES: hypothetical protein [unclassified Enterococcus]MBO0472035.1 hypothetical protein [Enterococcus sp. DIV0242_7C1]OUZ32978.1 hypothetical protein A5889_001687 [Enterococcus sp. 9D6_DIV0238]